jgi:NAD(P)-dependent dehydrogenase (short-subunit alcohol dehydrogenase family)
MNRRTLEVLATMIADAEKIAEAIAYLASDQASLIHGAVVPVDGRRTAI